jgi:hypothetical protein
MLTLGMSVAVVGWAVDTAKGDSARQVTLKGVLTDSMCGAKHMMIGDDAKCVRTCVNGGSNYALLAAHKVYQLTGQSQELERLAGKTINVTGVLNGDTVIQVSSLQSGSDRASTKTGAAEPASQIVTIEGLVRDIACPIQNKKATARSFNLKCALECARLGSPLIILTDDGTLYSPISSSMPDQDQRLRLAAYVGKYVRARGQVFERQGTRAIMIQDITELKGVHLVTDAE